MLKIISLLSVLIATANAGHRFATFHSGYITHGKHSSGVTVKQNGDNQEISWQETFDNCNSLTSYFIQVYEDTGMVEASKMNNICDKFGEETLENALKEFILQKFAKTNKCPIKKGTVKVNYPIKFRFQRNTGRCGPIIATFIIIRNNQRNSRTTPLLINVWLRGVIIGDDC